MCTSLRSIAIGVRVGFSNRASNLSFWPANDVPVHEKGADIYGYDLSSIPAYPQVGMMSQALVKAKSWRNWIEFQDAEHELTRAYAILDFVHGLSIPIYTARGANYSAQISLKSYTRWDHQDYRVVFLLRHCTRLRAIVPMLRSKQAEVRNATLAVWVAPTEEKPPGGGTQ
jgi:hypothetical protein